jgi:hypothetical protein
LPVLSRPAENPSDSPVVRYTGCVTQLLDKAIEQVKHLPAAEQDAIAALILDELEDEKRWDDLFARSQDLLAGLAAKAEAQDRAALAQAFDPDTL